MNWVIVAIVSAMRLSLPQASATEVPGVIDSVCGPRCVQYVLARYGVRVELHDLIVELQWPEVSKGASLADLARALEGRGIRTRLSVAPRLDAYEAAQPAIAYIRGETQLGHFVVVERRDGALVLWDGATGTLNAPESIDVPVLLTSSLAMGPTVGYPDRWIFLCLAAGLIAVGSSLAFGGARCVARGRGRQVAPSAGRRARTIGVCGSEVSSWLLTRRPREGLQASRVGHPVFEGE